MSNSTRAISPVLQAAIDAANQGDYARALPTVADLANQGDDAAQCMLAHLFRGGHGTPRDYSKAEHWYRLAAKQQNSQAMLCLANMFYFGTERPADIRQAFDMYYEAAGNGNAEAQFCVGCMFENGEAVAESFGEAASWYLKAAEQGYPEAQYAIGRFYFTGKAPSDDPDSYVEWFLKAAESGVIRAQVTLSIIFDDDVGSRKDDTKSLLWLTKAAEGGDPGCQFRLACRFAIGKGFPRDQATAAMWLRKAAEQGHAVAQRDLADAYLSGNGVPKNEQEALLWFGKAFQQFETAAHQGDSDAQTHLGLAYLRGEGVPRNDALAFIWLDLATANDDPFAQDDRNKLLSAMSKDQIIEAWNGSLTMGLEPLEIAATKALHAKIGNLVAESEFSAPDIYISAVTQTILTNARNEHEQVPIQDIFAAFMRCIRRLYEVERLFLPPELPSDELLIGLKGANYRDSLYEYQKKLADSGATFEAMSLCILTMYNAFAASLSPYALCDPDSLDRGFVTSSKTSYVIDAIPNVPRAVHEMLNPFLREDLNELALFSGISEQIFSNLHKATKDAFPNLPVTVDRSVLPANSKLPPREVANTYLQDTPFLELFYTSVKLPGPQSSMIRPAGQSINKERPGGVLGTAPSWSQRLRGMAKRLF